MQLKHLLARHFPDIPPARLPGGFDVVGDIAVIGITPEAEPHEEAIGRTILARYRHIRVVAKRAGQHGGTYRTLPLQVIAGEERLVTMHRENGVLLHLDLARAYFSTRSAHERARIAALVAPGEKVAVLCSGVGPFPLIIGRHSHAAAILGIESNPVAHACALRNLTANRRITTVRFLHGDAAQVLLGLDQRFDRILVVLPHGGEALLPAALDALLPGGRLHFYDMQARDCVNATAAKVEAACRLRRRNAHLLGTTLCGHCGPQLHRVCLEAVITPA